MGMEFEQKQKNVEAAVVVELERPQPQPPSRQQPPSTTTKKTNNPIPGELFGLFFLYSYLLVFRMANTLSKSVVDLI